MDAAFVVYLPVEAELEGFPFKVPMFEWGGEQHPQGEPECGFGLNFRLKKMKPPSTLRLGNNAGKLPASGLAARYD